jgi:3-dehydroquinate synthase
MLIFQNNFEHFYITYISLLMSDYRQCCSSKIFMEPFSILNTLIQHEDAIFLIDSNVFNLYQDLFTDEKIIIVPSGENAKQLTAIESIYLELLYAGANRNSLIVGIGGGVTLDIAGFVASTFMRGVRFGFVPTTLLAMTDAAIGGKNGVNIEEYKNIIGCFNSPEFVIIDSEFIRTLLNKDVRSGFAEVIKHGLIADSSIIDFLKQSKEDLLNKKIELLGELIFRSTQVKIDIVGNDEKETGIRKILNFGHTLGHAIERILDISHGEAVAIGMVFATKISHHFNMIDKGYLNEIIALIEQFKLPTKIDVDKAMILEIMLRDKKRSNDAIEYILLDGRGKAIIKPLIKEELEELIGKFL